MSNFIICKFYYLQVIHVSCLQAEENANVVGANEDEDTGLDGPNLKVRLFAILFFLLWIILIYTLDYGDFFFYLQ